MTSYVRAGINSTTKWMRQRLLALGSPGCKLHEYCTYVMACAQLYEVMEQHWYATLWHEKDSCKNCQLSFLRALQQQSFDLPEILERACYQQSSKVKFLRRHLPLYHWNSSAAVCANCSEDPPALCMLPKGVELPLSAGTALELGGADSGAASGRGTGPEMTPALYSVCKLRST